MLRRTREHGTRDAPTGQCKVGHDRYTNTGTSVEPKRMQASVPCVGQQHVPILAFHALQSLHASVNSLISRNRLLARLRAQHSTRKSHELACLSPGGHTLFQQKARKRSSLPPCVHNREQHVTSFGTKARFSPQQKNLHFAGDKDTSIQIHLINQN